MDDDEVFTTLAAAVITIVAVIRWYGPLLSLTPLGERRGRRILLGLLPLPLLAGLQWVLVHWAAHEVRDDPRYVGLFLVSGAAWLGMTLCCLPLVGLSARDDVLESRNPAAVVALFGASTGMLLCYAGGNVGEGPTIWTTFGPAALAGLTLFGLWFVLEVLTGGREAIAIDRDVASAARLAGFLVAAGLILGRGVAGDWHSWDNTFSDLLTEGWPAFILMLATCTFHLIWRPSLRRPYAPVFSRGIIPAFFLVAIAVLDVFMLGWPDHNR